MGRKPSKYEAMKFVVESIIDESREIRLSGDLKRSEEILQDYLQNHPDNLQVLFEIAVLYETVYLDYHRALEMYNRILKIDPEQIRAWHARGILLYLMCNDEGARYALEKVIELRPDFSAVAYLFLAKMESGRSNAITLLEMAVSINGELAEAREYLGDLYAGSGREEEALLEYEAVLKLTPDHDTVKLKKAKLLHNDGRLDDLKELLEQKGNLEFEADYWFFQSELHQKEDDPDLAEECLRRTILMNSEHSMALLSLARLLADRSRYEEAYTFLEKHISLVGESPAILHLKGKLLTELNRQSEAIDVYDQILNANSDDPGALLQKAEIHIRLNDFENSLTLIDRYLEMQGENAQAHFHRATCLEHLERFEEAIASYDRVLELNDHYGSAYNNRGYCKYRLGLYTDAIEDYTSTLNLKDDFAAGWYNRACSLSMLENVTEAMEDLKKAIQIRERYRVLASRDSDFDPIRSHPSFQSVLDSREES